MTINNEVMKIAIRSERKLLVGSIVLDLSELSIENIRKVHTLVNDLLYEVKK